MVINYSNGMRTSRPKSVCGTIPFLVTFKVSLKKIARQPQNKKLHITNLKNEITKTEYIHNINKNMTSLKQESNVNVVDGIF